MFPALKQFVPSSVCLKCDGCCRFKEENSSWRPKVVPEEVVQIQISGLAAEIFARNPFLPDGPRTGTVQGGHIQANACHGTEGFQCSFFKADDHTCRIFTKRPFDCQLYPFVLTREGGQPVLCVHLHCPHVQQTRFSPVFERYAEYLKDFFRRREVRDFLKENPTLVGDYALYRSELEVMFSIPLN